MRDVIVHLLVVLGISLPLLAGTADSPNTGPNDGRLWVRGELNIPGRYYYRGFKQERHGLIVQPALRFGADLWWPEEGPVNRVSALIGVRGSFHSRHTGAADTGPASWYEADLFGGIQVQMFDRLKAELLYADISSPNGAFDHIEEINLNANYDDAGLWPGSFALYPWGAIKTEIGGTSAAGGPKGTLLQLGMEPGFNPFESQTLPLRVSFPMEVGISLDNYYYLPEPYAGHDDTLGYGKVGVAVSMPLFFVPKDYGQWLVTVGVDYIQLGDNLETFNLGRDHDFIPRITFRMQY